MKNPNTQKKKLRIHKHNILTSIIIDDEPKALKSLTWELSNFSNEIEVKATFKDPEKALIYLAENEIDCLFLDIEIEDNGIGRKGAAIIKSKKSINRTSMGINLTKDRLTNFVKQFNNNYSIIYEDLKDKKNIDAGTKVRIILPLS